MPANPPDGTALLARATVETLESDAKQVERLMRVVADASAFLLSDQSKATLLRLTALARAVAKAQVEHTDFAWGTNEVFTLSLKRRSALHPSFPAALAALLGGTDD